MYILPEVSSEADNKMELSGEKRVLYTEPQWPWRSTRSLDTVSNLGLCESRS